MKWISLLVALIVGLVLGYIFPKGTYTHKSGGEAEREADASVVITTKEASARQASSIKAENVGDTTSERSTEEWLASLEGKNSFDRIGAIHERLKNVKPEDFATMMDALGSSITTMGWTSRNMLGTRWAEVDPVGMLNYIQQQPSGQQWGLQSSLFGAWAKRDPDAALAASQTLGSESLQRAAINAIIGSVAEENPQRAIHIFEDYGQRSSQREWILRNIFQRWSKQDGAAARAAALAMAEGPSRAAALSAALSEWSDRDPYGALEWLDALPKNATTYKSRKQVLRNLINDNFEVAQQYVENIDDPLQRRDLLQNFYMGHIGWQKDYEAIEGVIDWFGTVTTGQLYDQKVRDVVKALVESDSERAIEFVLQMNPGNARNNSLGALASKLAEEDPEAALSFVTSLEYEDEKRQVLNNMGWALTQSGVIRASELVVQSTEPIVQELLASRIADEWSAFDRDGALQWAKQLTDEKARENAQKSIFKNWIQSDPVGALGFVQSLPEDSQSGYFYSGFREWAREDPAMATSWLDRLPKDWEAVDENIYRSVTETFFRHDPMATSKWVAGLEEGDHRDASVTSLVNKINRTDPEAGFIWATTIRDENKRKNSLAQSVRKWARTEPDLAEKAIDEAEISAAEKEPLLDIIAKTRTAE